MPLEHNLILVLTRDQAKYKIKLDNMKLAGAKISAPQSDQEIESVVAEATVILGDSPEVAKWITKAKNCRWVQSTFAGIDALIDEQLPRNYQLTNVKETYGLCMAEFVLSYVLFFEKRIQEHIACQRRSQWEQYPYEPMSRLKVGIMGTGSIGRQIASHLKMLGCRVLGYRNTDSSVDPFDEVYTKSNVAHFLEDLDYLVSVLPHTSDTQRVINEVVLEQLPSKAVLINIGRGSAVDTQALIKALEQNKLKAAVLDVFEQEPLPENSPLWNQENIYITPHVSGYQINERIFEIFKENYSRFINGGELAYQVDFAKGY